MARILCILTVLVGLSCSALASGVKQCYFCADCGPDPYNTTSGIKQTCQSSPINSNSLFKNNYAEVSADVEWVCGKIKMSKDSKAVVQRTCTPAKVNGKAACDIAKDSAKAAGVTVDFCDTCTSDLCNSSNVLVSSLVIVMAAFLFKHIL